MQNVEDVEGHDNDSVTKESDHLVKEVDDVEEENMEPDEAMPKWMVYMRKPLLAEKCHDTQMTDKERTRREMERKIYALDALGMLLLGLVFSYAPQYIQVNIPWLTNGSEIMCLLLLAGSVKVFSEAYPHLFTRENIIWWSHLSRQFVTENKIELSSSRNSCSLTYVDLPGCFIV